MADVTTMQAPLVDGLWRAEGRQGRLVRNIVLVLAGTALIAVSAKINVPMVPVPMTMQTFAVLVIGMAYGWRLGGATLLAYLGEGLIGLPVFAGPVAGPAYLIGPTAGYLAAFFLAAVAVGWLAERGWDRTVARTLVANAIGTAIIFTLGAAWLAVFLAGAKDLGAGAALSAAVASGVTPFLIGAAAKIALAAAVLPIARKAVGRT